MHFPLAVPLRWQQTSAPLHPTKQEPVAEPDQLARPLRTGKVGAWDSTIWPLSQKDSWARDAERGLRVTWPGLGRWGRRKPAAAAGVRTKGRHKGNTGIREIKGERKRRRIEIKRERREWESKKEEETHRRRHKDKDRDR